jgi:hypothetical protein
MNVVTETAEVMQQIKKDRQAFLSGRHKIETEKVLAKQRGQTLQVIGHSINAARVAARLYGSNSVPFLPAPKKVKLEKPASKKLRAAA